MTTTRVALAGLLAVTSCRLTPPPAPVPVEGTHQELSSITGTWTGKYWSQETSRRGIIQFAMPEHADSGFGEVEITFSPALSFARDAAEADPVKSHSRADDMPSKPCTVLNIRIVRLEHDLVRGTMEPYWDPDCNCRARTLFEGRLSGNRITGTFTSRRESPDRRLLTGRWQVDRER